ncbi:MAG: BREX system ATP-binding protein BrxD [Pseudanabaena frigida]|uniref:BREX system ATP-binding protein BrxD n=1 Tax=Pseudanabaena frigida TaxID=945775 RepID=A0A2W4WA72_9CYAN|nr:MAG: BREX system ATP-binding protein BrxD [Pseudanabaena frigida]
MGLSIKDTEHVFEKLRSGVVPERGLEAFAVGIDRSRQEIQRQLNLAASGEGVFKFLRGGYGCGKTFMSRLATLEARDRGFATSFIVVSDNDLHFHKFDDVYRKAIQEIGTNVCPRGALGDILDRWIARVEDMLIAGGRDENDPNFDDAVRDRLDEELASMTGGQVPEDMTRVLRTIFTFKQQGNFAEASALISWLSGSENVAASAKKAAGIKGDIGSREALDYLLGILQIVKAAGYKGWAIVIDEAETILRMRQDVRGKSLNGIRQICDAADRFHGLLWIFTGTPDFFDTKRGIAGLPPLHDRIKFETYGGFSNPRQPQLELTPFDAVRLKEVALRLRELFNAPDPIHLERKITLEFIDRLIAEVTKGFKGDVGVVPRQFLRQFVNILDLVADNPDFDPSSTLSISDDNLNDDERRLKSGLPYYDSAPEENETYAVVEF